jgi:hypothetical protein
MSSSKLPVVMRFSAVFVYSGEGLLLTAACNASFTSLLRLALSVDPAASFGTMSSRSTCKPMPAK